VLSRPVEFSKLLLQYLTAATEKIVLADAVNES
jgi:hypothetical protein